MIYLITFIMMTVLYLATSIRKKKIINLLFFPYISLGCIQVFLYIFYLAANGKFFNVRTGDWYLFFYYWCVFISCYLIEKKKVIVNLPVMDNRKLGTPFIVFFVILLCAYAVMNIDKIYLMIANPRMYYANSRLGEGVLYYVLKPIVLLLYFYAIATIKFKSYKSYVIRSVLISIPIVAVLYLLGQKSNLYIIVLILLVTLFYRSNDKHRNVRIIMLGVVGVLFLFVVFAAYFAQQNMGSGDLFDKFVGYSDYLRNFCDLVDNLDSFYFGEIFFENEVLSYIPRAIWTNKPELYGSLKLGLDVPRLVGWTEALTGAPSFGVLGTAYADFGVVGVSLRTVYQIFVFCIAKTYEYRLEKRYNFWDQFLLFTFVDMIFFDTVLPLLPIYQLVVIVLLYVFSKKKRGKLYGNFNKCYNSFR